MSEFPRNPLSEENAKTAAEALQPLLTHLIDLSLAAKQVHWTLVGQQFLSVHEKLDDVVKTCRKGSDTIAERMAQLGHAPDGRSNCVVESSDLSKSLPVEFIRVASGLTQMCDRIQKAGDVLRDAREKIEDADPFAEDQLIEIGQGLDEHLWMLQAMEKGA